MYVLFFSGRRDKNTISQEAYKQKKFISRSSGDWEVLGQVQADSMSDEAHFLVYRHLLFIITSHVGRGELALWDLFHMGTNAGHGMI